MCPSLPDYSGVWIFPLRKVQLCATACFSSVLRVIPVPYRIIVGFGQNLSGNNTDILDKTVNNRAILRLNLSISSKDWNSCSFLTFCSFCTFLSGK